MNECCVYVCVCVYIHTHTDIHTGNNTIYYLDTVNKFRTVFITKLLTIIYRFIMLLPMGSGQNLHI